MRDPADIASCPVDSGNVPVYAFANALGYSLCLLGIYRLSSNTLQYHPRYNTLSVPHKCRCREYIWWGASHKTCNQGNLRYTVMHAQDTNVITCFWGNLRTPWSGLDLDSYCWFTSEVFCGKVNAFVLFKKLVDSKARTLQAIQPIRVIMHLIVCTHQNMYVRGNVHMYCVFLWEYSFVTSGCGDFMYSITYSFHFMHGDMTLPARSEAILTESHALFHNFNR